ncbi:MAG: LamG domain-containing protein, partial [Candidatus Cloacimonadota bacterium]|nr:LamG domain-containing protein [Candidatus Cloacimonadota bacterium]
MAFNPADWSNKKKITIDSTKVDSALTDFPISIGLGSSVGQTNFDLSDIFTQLQSAGAGTSYVNRKKIAVTTMVSSVETELYTEIANWDQTNETASLWTKVPTVSSGTDTELTIYYDKTNSDNTTYIGDTGDTSAQSVWDSNFVGIWHMEQDPNGDATNAIKDSTSNANHGTPAGSMTSADLVDGKIGKAIDFDGSDDRVIVSDGATLRGMEAITIEVVLNVDTKDNYEKVFDYSSSASSNTDRKYRFQFDAAVDNGLTFALWDDSNTVIGVATIATFSTGSTSYVAGVYTGINAVDSVKMYKDGSLNTSGNGTGNNINNTVAGDLWFGGEQYLPPKTPYDGIMDEVRLSNIARSAAWIKATYHSNWDDLLTFASIFDPSEWTNKIKLTVDSSKVDEDLTDFPVLITLSSETGITDFDVTDVFDELSTVSGTKKIAITTFVSGVETELYSEIERWDWVNEQAWLWTKVPTISSGTDTNLYLYYDSDHADNTNYIGDTGDTPAQNVWDDNFKGVWHMSQDPNGDVTDAIKDSTSNANHVTPGGSMTSADLVDGKIGKAIDFDGSDDYLKISGGDVSLECDSLTIESTVYLETGVGVVIVTYRPQNAWADARGYGLSGSQFLKGSPTTSSWEAVAWTNAPSLDTWNYLVGMYQNSGDLTLWKNGASENSAT